MRRGGPNSSVRTSFRWSAVLTLTILSFIPFAALFFFMASYFLRTKQAQGQIMKQQNSIALSSQQEKISSTEVSDTIKEKSLLYNSSTQSRQQPLKQATIVDELQHCDGQNDTNDDACDELVSPVNANGNIITVDNQNVRDIRRPNIMDANLNKNDRIVGNSKMQKESLHPLRDQNIAKIPPVITIEEENISGKYGNRNESTYEKITYVTPQLPNQSRTCISDRIIPQKILNDSLASSSHPISKHTFSRISRDPTEENSACTEFTIPEFQTNLSKSLMTEEC